MKYVVTIKYYDFVFDDASEALNFAQLAVEHMSDDMSVSIKLLTNEKEED